MKTIITRAGYGSKVICLGNLAQIDTPYLNPASSGLTYLTQRSRDFEFAVRFSWKVCHVRRWQHLRRQICNNHPNPLGGLLPADFLFTVLRRDPGQNKIQLGVHFYITSSSYAATSDRSCLNDACRADI